MVDLFSIGGLVLAFILVFMNGLFVAAEFAFVKVRPTQVHALVEDGTPGATLVQDAIDHLDDYLAVSQLGITLSSLGLGWIGEPAVAALIEPVLGAVIPAATLHLVAFALGFGFITFLHVVFGELMPKTIAIQQAPRIALLVAPLMKFFYYAFRPGLIVFNGTANFLTQLIGVLPASAHEETHTEEEIRMILTRSEETGEIDIDEVEMIERVFELGDVTARNVMVPRPDVATVPAAMPLAELRRVAASGRYTRYLVVDDAGERPLGFVHVKDILRAIETADAPAALTAQDLAREVLAVPESRRVDALLDDFQRRGEGQLAVVIDEWGAIAGIVTIEDVLEEIVGDIRDEFDPAGPAPAIEQREDGTWVVDGSVPIPDVNERLGTAFKRDAVETIGGYVFSQLGRTPAVGDRIERQGHVLRVAAVEDARITRLEIHPGGTAPGDGAT